jgi:hypothetical protein
VKRWQIGARPLRREVSESNEPYATDYAVTADGQRFLVNTVVDQPTRPALTVILNWTAGLKK